MAAKQRVAILGGGMASITAAYELTSTPELRERYDVTDLPVGLAAGGKCASGRNAAYGERIEEHGLHIWFGFYENAFRVMRDAYEQLGRRPGEPLATWRDAFKPCDADRALRGVREPLAGMGLQPPAQPAHPGRHELPAHVLGGGPHDARLPLRALGGARRPPTRTPPAPPPVQLPFGIHLPFGVPFGIDRMAQPRRRAPRSLGPRPRPSGRSSTRWPSPSRASCWA